METTRVVVPTVSLAGVRATVPMVGLRELYDRAYRDVGRAAAQAGWTVVGPAVGWYHRMPTGTVDLTAGFVVDAAPGATSGEVTVVELPGGPALVTTHTGPYDELPGAWEQVERARAATGTDGRGDFWEDYVTDPEPGGDPSANVTRLVLPLRP